LIIISFCFIIGYKKSVRLKSQVLEASPKRPIEQVNTQLTPWREHHNYDLFDFQKFGDFLKTYQSAILLYVFS